jgi:hypothetical protein
MDEVSHVEAECILPIVEIQELLEMIARVTLFQIDEDDSFGLKLHSAWNDFTHYEG